MVVKWITHNAKQPAETEQNASTTNFREKNTAGYTKEKTYKTTSPHSDFFFVTLK